MKNVKYAALVALLLSSMSAGCSNNSWNPFRKKTPPPAPVDVATMDNTTLGSDEVRPTTINTATPMNTDPIPVSSGGGTTVFSTPDPVPAGGGATGGETTYTIQKKDTLWSIASRLLGNGQRYRDILAANPGLDAKKLAVGQTIKIPPK